MRVIGGQWRSRKLARPDTELTRPMPDRVREAIFAMLGSYFDTPAELPPLRVADVFAGSGAMGIEALSRGAVACRFFESNRTALEVLRQNLDTFGIDSRRCVESRDAWRTALSDPAGAPFDLILLDPPYRDAYDTSDAGPVRRYLGRLAAEPSGDMTVVLHHPKQVTFELPTDETWRTVLSRTFGSNGITVFAR